MAELFISPQSTTSSPPNNPNTRSSVHTRRERKKELYTRANERLTREVIEQINEIMQAQTNTPKIDNNGRT
jgi:hypothetical protein